MTKVNIILVILVFISAMILVTMRSHSKGYFDEIEKQRALSLNLEEEYKIMQLDRARLTNINRIKEKSTALGMELPSYDSRRVLRVGE